MAEAMSTERLERLAGLAELPCSCANADCGNYASALTAQEAQELAAEAKRARAQLAEIGETRQQFGVRTYDNDEDVEVMSGQEQARDLAEAWRREIPGSNPTVMVRTRQSKPGEWREVTE